LKRGEEEMALTHKSMKDKAEVKVIRKPDDKSRLYMSKAEALKRNELYREKQIKLKEASEKIDADNEAKIVAGDQKAGDMSEEQLIDSIDNLTSALKNESGVGSVARKKALKDQIKNLEDVLEEKNAKKDD
jgi:hypothetical protein